MFLHPRWKRSGKSREAAAFLKARESRCVGVISRFLHMDRVQDHLWVLPDSEGEIEALIFHCRRTLFPVCGGGELPPARFMRSLLRESPIHAIQGLREDAEQLEAQAEALGYFPCENIDYDLMALDREAPAGDAWGPPELILRKPRPEDREELFVLQGAYEQEEVLPRNAVFNPSSCRLSLDHLLKHERVLVAELDSRIVGKINTSAASFSRCQIGGVYVHPDYRGRGIASRMGAVFVRELLSTGRGISLFVKKHNRAARKVYRRMGFETLGDYRIAYY